MHRITCIIMPISLSKLKSRCRNMITMIQITNVSIVQFMPTWFYRLNWV